MVFIMSLVDEGLCGWDSKGSLKVTILAVFLKPLWVAGLGRVTASMGTELLHQGL